MSIEDALSEAEGASLDLVEISPKATPPVCRLMDYGKYKYQQSKRQHTAKQNQKISHLKEVKMRPKIEEHDYQFKLRNAVRFLEDGNKVKVLVMFMGRQVTRKEVGFSLLERFQQELGERAVLEQPPKNEGRSVFMILSPPKKK
jgi:translation initiation factor IF-3